MAGIVPELLVGPNYMQWSALMKNYLVANDLWGVVEGTEICPLNPLEAENEFKGWRKKNAAALHAIQISTVEHILSQIVRMDSAKLCWDYLANIPMIKVEMIFQQQNLLPDGNQANRNEGPNAEELYMKVEFRKLAKAIERGDTNAVKSLIKKHKDAIIQNKLKYEFDGTTPLHLATDMGNTEIVEMLLEILPKENLEVVDCRNQTALIAAAAEGSTKIVECLVKRNEKLISIPDKVDQLPLELACRYRHKETALYLYSLTPFELFLPQNGTFGSSIVLASIYGGMLDITLDIIRRCPSLATSPSGNETIPLVEISAATDLFPSGNTFIFWKRWIYSGIQIQLPNSSNDHVQISTTQGNEHMRQRNIIEKGFNKLEQFGSKFLELLGIKEIYDSKLRHAYGMEILRCMCEHVSTLDEVDFPKFGVSAALYYASILGVIEIVIGVMEADPSLATATDQKGNNIIMNAIIHRQEKIFSLVYAFHTRKYALMSSVNDEGNNMLHLAARLAPPDRLDRISGAALQMQREFQWYQEVERIIHPSAREDKNKFGFKPQELFSQSHKKLVADGEKWMKETATSSTVVGALIITIMFTAAFTVPGGNVQDTGFPIFVHEKLFKVFIIADAISLFASSTSVLMFLGVLTSRYAERDFLKSLPTKLMIGLSTLFISIAGMMVSFCATLMIMLKGDLKLVVPIVMIASVPVTLFILLQFPLLVEIFVSTYMPGLFDRDMRLWYKS